MKKLKVKYECGHTKTVWVVAPEYSIALFGLDKAIEIAVESISKDRCPKCQ